MLVTRIISLFFCLTMISCSKSLIPEQQKINAQQSEQKVSPDKPQEQKRNKVFNLPKGSFVLGDKEAPISIVSFVDYTCASCARVDRVMKRLLADPDLKKTINISYRQYPLRGTSVKPAKVALAAGLQGNEKFWRMSQKLFAADGELADKNYLIWAKEIGLDTDKFARDLVEKEDTLNKIIAGDRGMTVQIKKAQSPVGIFVGGYLFRGSVTFENLKGFIGAVIAHREKQYTNPQPQ